MVEKNQTEIQEMDANTQKSVKENMKENLQEGAQVSAYHYTYRALSPSQKKEVESILREYEPRSMERQSNFERLQRLKNQIARTVTIFGLSVGIVGCLIFGGGMSMVLLCPENQGFLVVGVALGVVGVAVMAAVYPLYKRLEKRLKKKHKDEIVWLCKSVLGDEGQNRQG